MAMATKYGKVVTYQKGIPPIDHVVLRDYVPN